MERLTKLVSFTPESWNNMPLSNGDLVWISVKQMYAGNAVRAYENHLEHVPPFEVCSTMCIIEEVLTEEPTEMHHDTPIHVYDINNGSRGIFGAYKYDIVRNLTHDNRRHFSAMRIQRVFRKYINYKKRLLKALALVQPVARAWYVSPNNPNHQKRMRAIAEKWGMRP